VSCPVNLRLAGESLRKPAGSLRTPRAAAWSFPAPLGRAGPRPWLRVPWRLTSRRTIVSPYPAVTFRTRARSLPQPSVLVGLPLNSAPVECHCRSGASPRQGSRFRGRGKRPARLRWTRCQPACHRRSEPEVEYDDPFAYPPHECHVVFHQQHRPASGRHIEKDVAQPLGLARVEP